MNWLTVGRGEAPLLLSFPHTGTEIPAEIGARLVSLDVARKDADWWVDRLYDFAADHGATTIHTRISRTVIDVNRDPSGASLYPGQTTSELCPITTFDGEPLYRAGAEPKSPEITERREKYFDPYHEALAAEIARLRKLHSRVVLYDCHSIRSAIPRLFDGTLPNFNIGTNNGSSCDPSLTQAVEEVCANSLFTRVVNGRFKGGWITRHYGRPADGVHAIQMELACRGYMTEPDGEVTHRNWPTQYDEAYATPMRRTLEMILEACRHFGQSPTPSI